MAFKNLTKTGKEFIRTICNGEGNNLLNGSNKYRLIFTDDGDNTIYNASPKDREGNTITTDSQLGESLIYWFDLYSELYELDANIIAAQAFIESKYVLWAFPHPHLNSSAQGITQFISSSLYDTAIGNKGISSTISILFTEEEINRLTDGLTDPKLQSSYIYVNNSGGESTALNNRLPLFQNCLDNPDLMIKAQCKLIKGISVKAGDNAASALFGYNQGPSYVRGTFTSTLKNAEPNTLPLSKYNDGLEYVNRVFRVLGDINYTEHKPSGIWFGYDIDFTFDEFKADVASSDNGLNNVDRSTILSKNYTLGDLIVSDKANEIGIFNVPNKNEFDKLKIFANTILEPINNLINDVLIVNSSFRSDLVNSKVGGVINSQHRLAEAGDVRVETSDPNLLFSIYELIISNGTIPYDQIIYETKGSSIAQRWIHISYNSDNISANRRQNLLATLVDGSMDYEPYVG